jgi:RNA polymerase sigma-70 factor, ECF subfamily
MTLRRTCPQEYRGNLQTTAEREETWKAKEMLPSWSPRSEPKTVTASRSTDLLTEAEAIRLAQAGDAAAFDYLYQVHGRRVYALRLQMVRNPADAEDLMQEAFLQLCRKIGTFRGESAYWTWLHRMAVNVVLIRSLRAASLEEATEPDEETGGPRKDVGAADLLLSGAVDRVNLERSIKKLPPGSRTIFVLHDVQGYEHNEIAHIMECSVGNSKSQLHKARTRLRELLQEEARDLARQEGSEGAGRKTILRYNMKVLGDFDVQ